MTLTVGQNIDNWAKAHISELRNKERELCRELTKAEVAKMMHETTDGNNKVLNDKDYYTWIHSDEGKASQQTLDYIKRGGSIFSAARTNLDGSRQKSYLDSLDTNYDESVYQQTGIKVEHKKEKPTNTYNQFIKTAHKKAIDDFEKQINTAQESFNQRMLDDNAYHDIADFLGRLWGENYADAVRRDISTAKKDLDSLKAAMEKGEAEFQNEYSRIFNRPFIAKNFQNYQTQKAIYEQVLPYKMQEDIFNNNFSYLLTYENLTMVHEAKFTPATMATPGAQAQSRLTEKEVYEREFKHLADFFDNIISSNKRTPEENKELANLKKQYEDLDNGLYAPGTPMHKMLTEQREKNMTRIAELEAKDGELLINLRIQLAFLQGELESKDKDSKEYKDMQSEIEKIKYNIEILECPNGTTYLDKIIEQAGKSDASLNEKYHVLRDVAQDISKKMHNETVKAGGGEEFSTVQRRYNNAYKIVFGDNDIIKRVTDYNISQEKGGQLIQGTATLIYAMIIARITQGIGMGAITGVAAAEGSTAAAVTGQVIGTAKAAVGFAAATALNEGVIVPATTGRNLQAFNEKGVVEYIKAIGKNTNWSEVAKATVNSAGIAVVLHGISVPVQGLCLLTGASKQATAWACAGASLAALEGQEYLATGTITLDNLVYNVVLTLTMTGIQVREIRAQETAKAEAMQQLKGSIEISKELLGIAPDKVLTIDELTEIYKQKVDNIVKNQTSQTVSDGSTQLSLEFQRSAYQMLMANLEFANKIATQTSATAETNPTGTSTSLTTPAGQNTAFTDVQGNTVPHEFSVTPRSEVTISAEKGSTTGAKTQAAVPAQAAEGNVYTPPKIAPKDNAEMQQAIKETVNAPQRLDALLYLRKFISSKNCNTETTRLWKKYEDAYRRGLTPEQLDQRLHDNAMKIMDETSAESSEQQAQTHETAQNVLDQAVKEGNYHIENGIYTPTDTNSPEALFSSLDAQIEAQKGWYEIGRNKNGNTEVRVPISSVNDPIKGTTYTYNIYEYNPETGALISKQTNVAQKDAGKLTNSQYVDHTKSSGNSGVLPSSFLPFGKKVMNWFTGGKSEGVKSTGSKPMDMTQVPDNAPVTGENLQKLGYKPFEMSSENQKSWQDTAEPGETFTAYMHNDSPQTILAVYTDGNGHVTRVKVVDVNTKKAQTIINQSNQIGNMKAVIDETVQELAKPAENTQPSSATDYPTEILPQETGKSYIDTNIRAEFRAKVEEGVKTAEGFKELYNEAKTPDEYGLIADKVNVESLPAEQRDEIITLRNEARIKYLEAQNGFIDLDARAAELNKQGTTYIKGTKANGNIEIRVPKSRTLLGFNISTKYDVYEFNDSGKCISKQENVSAKSLDKLTESETITPNSPKTDASQQVSNVKIDENGNIDLSDAVLPEDIASQEFEPASRNQGKQIEKSLAPELKAEFEDYAAKNGYTMSYTKSGNVVFRTSEGNIARRVDLDTSGNVKGDNVFVQAMTEPSLSQQTQQAVERQNAEFDRTIRQIDSEILRAKAQGKTEVMNHLRYQKSLLQNQKSIAELIAKGEANFTQAQLEEINKTINQVVTEMLRAKAQNKTEVINILKKQKASLQATKTMVEQSMKNAAHTAQVTADEIPYQPREEFQRTQPVPEQGGTAADSQTYTQLLREGKVEEANKFLTEATARRNAELAQRIFAEVTKDCGEPEVRKLLNKTQELYKDANGNEVAVVLKNKDGQIISLQVAEYDPQNPTARPKITNYGSEDSIRGQLSRVSAQEVQEFSDLLEASYPGEKSNQTLVNRFKQYPDGVRKLCDDNYVQRGLDDEQIYNLAKFMQEHPSECKYLLDLKDASGHYVFNVEQVPDLIETEVKFPGIAEQIINDTGMYTRRGDRQVSIIPGVAEAYAKNPDLVRQINHTIENNQSNIPIEVLAQVSLKDPKGVQLFILDPKFSRFETYWDNTSPVEAWEKVVKAHEENQELFDNLAQTCKVVDIPDVIDNLKTVELTKLSIPDVTAPKAEPASVTSQPTGEEMAAILKIATKNCGEPKVKDLQYRKIETYTDAEGNEVAVVCRNKQGEITRMQIAKYDGTNPRPQVESYGDKSEHLISKASAKEVQEFSNWLEKNWPGEESNPLMVESFRRYPDGTKTLFDENIIKRELGSDEIAQLAPCMQKYPKECTKLLELNDARGHYVFNVEEVLDLAETEAKFPGIIEKIIYDYQMEYRSNGIRGISEIPDIAEAYAKNPELTREIHVLCDKNGHFAFEKSLSKVSVDNPDGVKSFINDPNFETYKCHTAPEDWAKVIGYYQENPAIFNSLAKNCPIEKIPAIMDNLKTISRTSQSAQVKSTTVEEHSEPSQMTSVQMESVLKDAVKDCGEPEINNMILFNEEIYTDANGNIKAFVERALDGEIKSMEIVTSEPNPDSRPEVKSYGKTDGRTIQRAGQNEIDAIEASIKNALDKYANSLKPDDKSILDKFLSLNYSQARAFYKSLPKEQQRIVRQYHKNQVFLNIFLNVCKKYPTGVENLQQTAKKLGIELHYQDYTESLAEAMELYPDACERLFSIKGEKPTSHGVYVEDGIIYWSYENHDFILDPETIARVAKTEAQFPGVIEKILKDPAMNGLNVNPNYNFASGNILNDIAEAYSKNPQLVADIFNASGNIPREILCKASITQPEGVRKFLNKIKNVEIDYYAWANDKTYNAERVTKAMEYYDKYTADFDDIASDRTRSNDGSYYVRKWYVEDIPTIIDAKNINPEITEILRNHPKVNYASNISDFVQATKDCPRGAKFLLESNFNLELDEIKNLAPYVERDYNKAVDLVKRLPDMNWSQFRALFF